MHNQALPHPPLWFNACNTFLGYKYFLKLRKGLLFSLEVFKSIELVLVASTASLYTFAHGNRDPEDTSATDDYRYPSLIKILRRKIIMGNRTLILEHPSSQTRNWFKTWFGFRTVRVSQPN